MLVELAAREVNSFTMANISLALICWLYRLRFDL